MELESAQQAEAEAQQAEAEARRGGKQRRPTEQLREGSEQLREGSEQLRREVKRCPGRRSLLSPVSLLLRLPSRIGGKSDQRPSRTTPPMCSSNPRLTTARS